MKPGELPGPVYPEHLAQTQRQATAWAAGRKWHDRVSFGYKPTVTVDPAKEQRLHRALDPYFQAVVTERVEYPMALAGPKVLDLVRMTPSARHLSGADLGDDGLLPERATVSVLATAYRPRRPRAGTRAC